jgi:hypothetical protein
MGPRQLRAPPARLPAGHRGRGEPVFAPGCLQRRQIVPASHQSTIYRGIRASGSKKGRASGYTGSSQEPGYSQILVRVGGERRLRGTLPVRIPGRGHAGTGREGTRQPCRHPVRSSADHKDDDDRVTAPLCPCSPQSLPDVTDVTPVGGTLRSLWLIRVLRLIGGTGAHWIRTVPARALRAVGVV